MEDEGVLLPRTHCFLPLTTQPHRPFSKVQLMGALVVGALVGAQVCPLPVGTLVGAACRPLVCDRVRCACMHVAVL